MIICSLYNGKEWLCLLRKYPIRLKKEILITDPPHINWLATEFPFHIHLYILNIFHHAFKNVQKRPPAHKIIFFITIKIVTNGMLVKCLRIAGRQFRQLHIWYSSQSSKQASRR